MKKDKFLLPCPRPWLSVAASLPKLYENISFMWNGKIPLTLPSSRAFCSSFMAQTTRIHFPYMEWKSSSYPALVPGVLYKLNCPHCTKTFPLYGTEKFLLPCPRPWPSVVASWPRRLEPTLTREVTDGQPKKKVNFV